MLDLQEKQIFFDLDFCQICEICAQNCPSRSISFGDREINNGGLLFSRMTSSTERNHHPEKRLTYLEIDPLDQNCCDIIH